MILHRLGVIKKSQSGFSLIEVVVGMTIVGLIASGIGMAVYQVQTVSAMSTNHITALKQVQNAAYWIERDTKMAQIVQPGGSSGFPLALSWVEWDNTTHQVSYTLDISTFNRGESVNGGDPIVTRVAQNINADEEMTNCQFTNRVLTFKITASLGEYKPISKTMVARVVAQPTD